MTEPKHPNVHVKLAGENGNAFSILGRCSNAMRDAGIGQDERNAFQEEATSGDYDHLLRTVMRWFSTS